MKWCALLQAAAAVSMAAMRHDADELRSLWDGGYKMKSMTWLGGKVPRPHSEHAGRVGLRGEAMEQAER